MYYMGMSIVTVAWAIYHHHRRRCLPHTHRIWQHWKWIAYRNNSISTKIFMAVDAGRRIMWMRCGIAYTNSFFQPLWWTQTMFSLWIDGPQKNTEGAGSWFFFCGSGTHFRHAKMTLSMDGLIFREWNVIISALPEYLFPWCMALSHCIYQNPPYPIVSNWIMSRTFCHKFLWQISR